jgi:signal transduction histidine kinase
VILRLGALRWPLALGVVAFAGVTAFVGATHGAPTRFLILDTSFGLVFVVAGLVAWQRRPELPYGALLILCGVLWFVGSYAPTGAAPYSALGFAFERYYDVVLAGIVLTFAAGALSGAGRVALVVLGAAYLTRTASRLFVGCECMTNPTAVVDDPLLFERAQVATSAVIAVSAVAVAVLAIMRPLRESAAVRRVLLPVAVAGAVAALGAAFDAVDLITFVTTGDGLLRFAEPWREVATWMILFVSVVLVPVGYLLGVFRLRVRHGALGPLALELDRKPGPDDLQTALRQALGDPSAELLVWDRAHSVWLDARRRPVAAPVEEPPRAVTSVECDGQAIAAVVHDRALREDPGLLAATVALLRLALDNERLAAEVGEQLDQVRASRARLIEASEAERRRIERDLHDGAQQRLIAVALALDEARVEASQLATDAPFVKRLHDTADELMAAIEELRELARGIHPAVLTEDGLRVAVSSLARRAAVPVDVDITFNDRLPAAVEATAYYVVAESLANITRHARARSATIRMAHDNGHLDIDISDDGDGGADASRGSGLRGLADRLDAISGTLRIDSPPQGGTRLRAEIPCG